MFKCVKGRKFKHIFVNDPTITMNFEFRDKKLSIENLEDYEVEPYIGAILSRNQAVKLREFLDECLADKRCDVCYQQTIPSNFNINHEVRCNICGSVIYVPER